MDIERYTDRLRRFTPKSLGAYAKSDQMTKSAVERNIQLLSDSELDIAMQLYKGMELRIAGDDESVLDRLEGKLGKALTEKLRRRRRLRNEIIHAHADMDYDKEVFEQAHDLSDVEGFVREVSRLLKESR